MNTARYLPAVLVFVLAMPLSAARVASAQEDDSARLAEYRLTDDGLRNFAEASRNLAVLAKADPELAERMGQASEDATIDEAAALYDSEPAVREALDEADMSSTEYVTFMYSMMQAGMGAWMIQQYGDDKLPEGTPRENVEFYLANSEKIAALSEEMQALESDPE